jgi:hypothetical protein
MTDQLQFDRTLPLVIAEKTIAELECSIFVDFDCNEEPYVSEIWVEPITGKGLLTLGDDCGQFRVELLNILREPAWEAVKGDVEDAVLEAAA